MYGKAMAARAAVIILVEVIVRNDFLLLQGVGSLISVVEDVAEMTLVLQVVQEYLYLPACLTRDYSR